MNQCVYRRNQRPGTCHQSGCFDSQYDWEVLREGSNDPSRRTETVLCVLLDSGAQRHFSKVRITLCCSSAIPKQERESLQIEPKLSSVTVTNRISPCSGSSRPNSPNLPSYEAIFEVESVMKTNRLVRRTRPAPSFFHTFFEVECPLTEDTQTVSVSFTSVQSLETKIFCSATNCESPTLYPTFIGRVVRLKPNRPSHPRRTIHLPRDILLMIFEHFLEPEYRGWRRDLLSSGLVCRQWACALEMLLYDFRCWNKRIYGPQPFKLAKALCRFPDRGLSIKYLSMEHLTRSFSKVKLEKQTSWHSAVLSIMRAAKNIEALTLTPEVEFIPHSEILNVLRGLTRLETLEVNSKITGMTTMGQILAFVMVCPSVERLLIRQGWSVPFDKMPRSPLVGPGLKDLMLLDCRIWGRHLRYLVISSSLERLALRVWGVSNADLEASLFIISQTLVELRIEGFYEGQVSYGEEVYPLDKVITEMKRLKILKIDGDVATPLMLERRSVAFKNSLKDDGGQHPLPVVDLTLVLRYSLSPHRALESAIRGRTWPGWITCIKHIIQNDQNNDDVEPCFVDPDEFWKHGKQV